MGKMLKLSQAAKIIGISPTTLRTWAKENKIEYIVTPTGHRLFDEDVVHHFVYGKTTTTKNEETSLESVYIYARVSTKKQMESGNLDRQITRLTEHAIKKQYNIAGIFKEVASGINENRKELNKLLDQIKTNKNSIILVEYKDRLARFGYQYIQKHIEDFGSHIEVIETIEKDDEKELVEDLIAITTSFSARIYGKRGGKKATDKIKLVLNNTVKED
jgi:putative resolvase